MKRFLELFRSVWLPMLLLTAISGSLFAQFDLDSLPVPGGPPGLDRVGLDDGGSDAPLTVEAQFTAPDGQTPGYLFVTVEMKPGWHIYSMTQTGGPIPTKITVSKSNAVQNVGPFKPSTPPKEVKDPGFDIIVGNHYGTITWFAPLTFRPGVNPAFLEIKGSVYAQPCNETGCAPPESHPFTAKLASDPAKFQKLLATAGSKDASGFQIDSVQAAADKSAESGSLEWYILLGFLGGLILNVMPCVLPVIGLKIISFIGQAGHDRRHAFMLNVWYSLGLMSVFMLLAVLAITLKLGWGGLFRYSGMNTAMIVVVFVMALSFLGIWELPIPGFIGVGKAEEVSQKEGAIGAFAKGVLTTILATPCSAPLLASALAWAIPQPPINVFAVFASIGLGMASPYLLIGMFPALIKFLPKPGAWMETFKQVMGFVLLATVIFLLHSTQKEKVLPMVTFLFGLWAACWWIGKINVFAPGRIKLLHWGEAVAFAVLIWFFAFNWLGSKAAYELPWQPYTDSRFEQVMNEKKTVLVDFTADWCLNCKTFETFVLNTKPVYNAVEKHHVVTLRGDWTRREESVEVDEMLKRLGSKQVPVILVIPDGDPKRMSVFRGNYKKDDIIKAIEK